MLRKLFFLTLALFGAQQIHAGPVDFSQARKNAAAFLQKSGRSIDADDAGAKSAKKVWGGAPAYYVFNAEDEAGFVIVSGDDRTVPILGYTDSGAYDAQKLPENFRAWLKNYEEQIEALGEDVENPDSGAIAQTTPHNPEWAAITPLMKTTWNQYAPYNNLCPEINGQKTLSGCVATAVAQIMYYHAWPNEVTTSIPSYTTSTNGMYVEELQPTVFEWRNMPLHETQTDVNNAVARLMRYVGQAIEMDYGLYWSGAQSGSVAVALCDYFGYNKTTARFIGRPACSVAEWHELIYEELANKRPVYYSGSAPDAGHAFVCDGYDGNGYYHFNWGWGGSSDGFFLLEVLNPNGTGAGGSATNEGYTDWQYIIVGVQPDKDGTSEYPQDALHLTCENFECYDNKISARFGNQTHKVTDFEFGFAIDNGDNTFNVFNNSYFEDLRCGWGGNLDYQITSAAPFNQPGTYRVVPVSRELNKGEPWQNAADENNYVEVVVGEDLSITATLHPSPEFSVKSFSFSGDMYAWVEKNLSLTIENTGEEFYGEIYLSASHAASPEKTFQTSVLILSMPDTTFDVSIPCNFPAAGTWNIALSTKNNEAFWHDTVDVAEFIAAGQYVFKNYHYGHYLSAAASMAMVGLQNAAKRSVWDLQFVDGGATLQNVETGLYAHVGEAISGGWTLQAEPQVLKIYGEDGGRKGTLTFGVDEHSYFKMHEDGAGNIVNWCSQVETSWNFIPYTAEMDEDLAAEEATLLQADIASHKSTFDDIADALGGTYDKSELTLKDIANDGHFYRFFADNYYKFTSRKRKMNIGVAENGVVVGVEDSQKDLLQIWQIVPTQGGFKLYNPNLGAAGSEAYLGGFDEGYATLKSFEEAQTYNLEPQTRGFYLIAGLEEKDSVNMEGADHEFGDFALTPGGNYILFTASQAESIEVDLTPFAKGGAFAAPFLPFDVECASADVKMYVTGAINDSTIDLSEAACVKALNGFVLLADTAQTVALNVVSNDAAVESTLSGTIMPITLKRINRSNYLLLGALGAENPYSFSIVATSVKTLPANTAYVDNQERLYDNGLSFGGVLSGIEAIDNGQLTLDNGQSTMDNKAPVFDLSGRKVSIPMKGGIYVKNGRKFLAK